MNTIRNNVKPIHKLGVGDVVWCNTRHRQTMATCRVIAFKMTGTKPIIEVTLETGRVFSASVGHKVVTRQGKQPFEQARELHIVHHKTYSNDPQEALARLVGYNMGDGTIVMRKSYYRRQDGSVSQYGDYPQASFYAKSEADLERVSQDLALSGVSVEPPHVLLKRHKTGNIYQVHLSYSAARKLIEAGCPIGKKVEQDFDVPTWILNGTMAIKAEFLAALWGAEGSTPTRATGRARMPRMPGFSMYKQRKADGEPFFNQVVAMLHDLGIEATYHIVEKASKDRFNFTLYIGAGIDNFQRFFEQVGFRYAAHKEELTFAWQHYLAAYIQATHERQITAQQMRQSGQTYNQIAAHFGCSLQGAHNLVNKADHAKEPPRTFAYFEDWYECRRTAQGIYLDIVSRQTLDQEPHAPCTHWLPDSESSRWGCHS